MANFNIAKVKQSTPLPNGWYPVTNVIRCTDTPANTTPVNDANFTYINVGDPMTHGASYTPVAIGGSYDPNTQTFYTDENVAITVQVAQ